MGTLVVLAAAAFAGPSSAYAGCSHDAVSGKTRATMPASLERIQLPATPVHPPKPCDGPSCSGNPAAPATSPVVAPPLAAEHWGCLPAAVATEEVSGWPFLASELLSRAARRGIRLDRPPRLCGRPGA